ncbi:MAG TPA: TlpA disulfide reductase family protein [Allosphingosinicella sp.]|jgi:thiol-disulfide isomerase/thioredoxin
MLPELPLRPEIFRLLGFAALASASCDREKAAEPQGGGPDANAARPAAAAYPTGRLDRSRAGAAAPSVPFEDGEGQPATLADFRGRPLLVNFWATWCPPCVREMPSLDRLAAQQGRNGVQVIAISQDLDGRQKVADFFAERRLAELEPYLDGDMAFMTALRIETLPTTILYDAAGREVWRMTGMAEWDGERASGLLREAERR